MCSKVFFQPNKSLLRSQITSLDCGCTSLREFTAIDLSMPSIWPLSKVLPTSFAPSHSPNTT